MEVKENIDKIKEENKKLKKLVLLYVEMKGGLLPGETPEDRLEYLLDITEA